MFYTSVQVVNVFFACQFQTFANLSLSVCPLDKKVLKEFSE